MVPKWKLVEVETRPGQLLLIGDCGRPGVLIHLLPANGLVFQAVSGDKAEHGAGGFEFPIYGPGLHGLEIAGDRFDLIPARDATTWIRLAEDDSGDGPPAATAGPESSGDAAAGGPPGGWPALFERLDKIQALLERYLAGLADG